MRTNLAQTSLEAYRSLPPIELQRKEKEVMAVFITNPGLTITREQLSAYLGWKESAICARCNSLVTKKVLEEIDGGKTKSGRSAKLLRLPVKGQIDMFSGGH